MAIGSTCSYGIPRTTSATRLTETADVCRTLFKFCRDCNERYLEPRKIQCLFDVAGGWMAQSTLRAVCEMIETLMADIAVQTTARAAGGSVTITLRRQHGAWIFAAIERQIPAERTAARRLALVRRVARKIDAACRIEETADGCITALIFDAGTVAHAGAPTLH